VVQVGYLVGGILGLFKWQESRQKQEGVYEYNLKSRKLEEDLREVERVISYRRALRQ